MHRKIGIRVSLTTILVQQTTSIINYKVSLQIFYKKKKKNRNEKIFKLCLK